MSMQSLDPLYCPLSGRQLIEASAGTGKTYTIAILFLRLLIESRLTIDQILVVTFTDAATEELRGRIRNRVREALDLLRDVPQTKGDPLLQELMQKVEHRQQAQALLADALVRMDEASVFTIHGFCGRMLRDNAFDSRMPFDVEFITDETHLRHEIICDFWRVRSAELNQQQTRWLLFFWKTPDSLLEQLRDALNHRELKIIPDLGAPAQRQAMRQLESDFQALKCAWENDADDVADLLRNDGALNRRSYSKKIVAESLQQMREMLEQDEYPVTLPIRMERFSNEKLAVSLKKNHQAPQHLIFDLASQLIHSHENARQLMKAAWQAEALGYLHEQLDLRKQELGQLYFDDLLQGMADGLRSKDGERLAQLVRARFPVAMIDEFQDTDPLQYGIFERIYTQDSDTGLFMIGDPKQAIYSFRGADIFTYMQARRETARDGHQYTLDTNWRSSSGLVESINTLFGRAAVNNPFIYEPDIDFQPVAASSETDTEPLTIEGETPSPLRFWLMQGESDKPLAIGVSKDRAALACAEEIARLLQLADQGQALVGDQPLQAREIAVLVRSHADATLMQQALRQCAVASVTQARESVFESAEANDLLLLLSAIAEPGREQQLRTALVSDLVGYSLAEMSDLTADEVKWDALLQRFRGYRDGWLKQGFMASFQRLLQDEDLPQKLLSQIGGERRLTNLMHLAELLQTASVERPGIEGVIRWFIEQRESLSQGESAELRLESDAALVQILTIHKSKGLEFPVVFLPFPWVSSKPKGMLLFHDEQTSELTLDLASGQQEDHRLLAQKEALAEGLRLFYVAVTRAKHLCVMTWGQIKGAEKSAPVWLLHQTNANQSYELAMPETLDQIREQLLSLSEDSGNRIEIVDMPEPAGAIYEQGIDPNRKLQAAQAKGRIASDWRQVSYSGLTVGLESGRPDYDEVEHAAQQPQTMLTSDSIFRFPRGPQAGTFMHTLLEYMDFTRGATAELTELVKRQLSCHGFEQSWSDTLQKMLLNVVNTELDDSGLKLSRINRSQRCDEMAFYFPLEDLSASGLRKVLQDNELYGSTAEQLRFDAVKGLMKGFIDLVFEHEGRFYLVDYKSNHLGDRPEEYDQPALAAAMHQHHYDFQYLIYTVALHRYLAQRIKDYDYVRHFGGVYYLFLRGMQEGSSYGIYHARPEQRLVGLLNRLFAGEQGADL